MVISLLRIALPWAYVTLCTLYSSLAASICSLMEGFSMRFAERVSPVWVLRSEELMKVPTPPPYDKVASTLGKKMFQRVSTPR